MRTVGSVVAVVLVVAALVAPAAFTDLTPAAFARIPLEGLVAVAVLLVLRGGARRIAAVAFGVLLGLLTVLRLFDLGFSAVLDRPFDPLTDAGLVKGGVDFVRSSSGGAAAVGAVVGAVVLGLLVVAGVTAAVLRTAHLVTSRPAPSRRVVAVLTVAWTVLAGLGAQTAGLPVASRDAATLAAAHVGQIGAAVADRREFEAAAARDEFRTTPPADLLTALRGKDVVLTYVESYGRSALTDPSVAARLDGAGLPARSAWLTSPTFGGGSWLAHSTLESGVRIDDQTRFDDLDATGRLTLAAAFRRAGWDTAAVQPGTTSGFPDADFYGYDQVLDAQLLGYEGPAFSFATMPDQYTLATFQQRLRAPGHAPLMAGITLVSSHAPWTPLPTLLPWDRVGDGSVYATMSGPSLPPQAILTTDPAVVRADYLASIRYSLATLISYLQNYGDDDLVMVFLGDHQPAPVATGNDPNRDVPVTVVAKDPAVLDRIAGWGWDPGLRPGAQAPVWGMDAFRDRFLTAFGPAGSQPPSR
ncbi:sulfatase-like hydrolase/transferase [Pseudonocardia sp. N23]|uniref:sulfatase-like hydrolase/transferase n=1 Tax=Pseudonocardia sp. N23 TaxID=1987376 RepID=UPI000BFC13CA|nr:sulfatase-like hydrolase/transferase [Pseudonocardia sp. N23]GAY07145.1 CDP-alcohol phosphatidyltransferase [Pseudonocardia sp. N23]